MDWSRSSPHGEASAPAPEGSFSARISHFSDITDLSVHEIEYEQQQDQPEQTPTQWDQTSRAREDSLVSLPSPAQHAYPHSHVDLRTRDSQVSLSSTSDLPLRGRESLLSLQSTYDPYVTPVTASPTLTQSPTQHQPLDGNVGPNYPPPATAWSTRPQDTESGYEPVRRTSHLRQSPSTSSSRSSWRQRGLGRISSHSYNMISRHDTIPEEFDMALLPGAAPIAGAEVSSSGLPPLLFDPTTTLGLVGAEDNELVRQMQQAEASGHLTGGIGTGWRPEQVLRGSDLLQPAPGIQRRLTTTLAQRRNNLDRTATLRGLGQDEANRRGRVIEVVIEEPAEVDISSIVGPESLHDDERPDDDTARRSVFRGGGTTTEIFYPKPNWKPFSMRWPYLMCLVFLSIGLAVMQEVLLQKSMREPLLTFHTPKDVPTGLYFSFRYLPTITSVLYGVLWQFCDFEVRRLEAYYQLSKPGGALAAESINVDYVTGLNIMRPFHALKLKHYAVTLSSIATIFAVSLVPTFGAAAFVLAPDRESRLQDPNGEKSIVIQAIWSRLLTVTLSLCAVLGISLFYMLQTRRSGLVADIKGIAGLASMAVVCHIIMDFKDMDTVKHQDIHSKLKYHRYLLRNSALAPDDENPISELRESRYERSHLSENPHPLMFRSGGSVTFIIGVLLFMGFIPLFLFTEVAAVASHAPWLITALAVCIKLTWGSLDTAVRMMEPYYILSKRHAPPKTLTLDYTSLPFGYLPIRAFMNGHYIMFLVGLGTVIAEILTVLLTSLSTVAGRDFIGLSPDAGDGSDDKGGDPAEQINSGPETVKTFWFSFIFALLILLYLASVATVVYVRRRHPFLPRQPNTIASVLAYIHQSKMLYNFVGTSTLNHKQMEEKLQSLQKTYGLGWFQGRDGRMHCGVDEEELMGNYRHGLLLGDSNNPWNEQWDRL